MKKIHSGELQGTWQKLWLAIVGTIKKNFPHMRKKTNQNHLKLESITASEMEEYQ